MSSKVPPLADNRGGSKVSAPARRFPEFREAGAWETVSLGSVASISTKKVGEKTCVPMSITAGVGLVSQMEKFGRIIAGDSYKNYLLLQKNDFAYNKSATKEYREGFIALYTGDDLAAVPNSIFTCFRIKGASLSPKYLNYLLLGNLHGRWLRKFIEVGARAHGSLSINDRDLLAMPVPIPGGPFSLQEQEVIADCLASVDSLIAAQGRKVEALRAHKKSLMQQLFPQDGENRPRLRFPEFRNDGDWSEKIIAELAAIQSGATPSKANADFWGGSIPWVSAKDMKRLFLEDSEDHISEEAIENGARLVPAGTLLVLTRGMTLLKDVPICIVRREMSFNQDVKGLRPRSGVNGLFLAWMLVANKGRLLSMVNIAGHGTGKIDSEALKALTLRVPRPPEQQRIARCLTSLDDLIAAESQKLDTLRTHKKGLMQQLFPSVVEDDA
jgi:type I restriction enzyme, S subunit